MKNEHIITVTINPSLDKSTDFKGLVPEQKIKCKAPRYDAGGGGINVSKAIARLGGATTAIFTSGGASGNMIKELLAAESIAYKVVETESHTRENFIAVDTNTNSQYRFGLPGNPLTNAEIEEFKKIVTEYKTQYLVISGSLSQSLPRDFYQDIIKDAKAKGIKILLDSSGEALEKALEVGVYLIKPNIGELAKMVGAENLESQEIKIAARKIIDQGGAEVIVVSLGPQGAILVTKDFYEYVPAPRVIKRSTVGAGDSMLGGMVWALNQEKSLDEVLRWGIACGSAATMNEGTQLFKKEDAVRMYEWLIDK